MPWNNQGGGGQGGPWGNRPGGGGGGGGPNVQPPDLEELIRKSQEKMKDLFPGGGGGGLSKRAIGLAGLVLLLLALSAPANTARIYVLSADDWARPRSLLAIQLFDIDDETARVRGIALMHDTLSVLASRERISTRTSCRRTSSPSAPSSSRLSPATW